MLALPRHRFGQAGKPVRTKPHRADPAGKPLAQAGDSLLERSLRAQRGAAQEPRFHHEPKPLLRSQRLGRLEPLQRQFRLAAIEA